MPAKARYLFMVFIVVAAILLGPKKLEPLMDTARHDPLLGVLILIIVLILVMVVVRVVRG